jgi:aldose sugar dehydrogenase
MAVTNKSHGVPASGIPYTYLFALVGILILLMIQEGVALKGDFTIQSFSPTVNDSSLKVDLIFKGLEFPSSMAFIGPNDVLIAEKNTGTVMRITNGTISSEPLLDVNVANKGERGMLGIAVANNETNLETQVFLYYTETADEDGTDTPAGDNIVCGCLYRYQLVNNTLVNPKLLLMLNVKPPVEHGIPVHLGGKVVIGPDNNVYISIGDLGGRLTQATQGTWPPDGTGGILVMSQDGMPVNRILGSQFPTYFYYAYGIRNSYGMDFDPVTGKLWDTENGGEFADEINLVEPGFNSGWNRVQGIWEHGVPSQNNYLPENITLSPTDLVDFNGNGSYKEPKFIWYYSVGPTALKFMDSDKLGKQYENDIFVGDFHTGSISNFNLRANRFELALTGPLQDGIANNNDERRETIFGEGFGGVIDIQVGPDGYLYILSLFFGGDDCRSQSPDLPCVKYDSRNLGSIFRISPATPRIPMLKHTNV